LFNFSRLQVFVEHTAHSAIDVLTLVGWWLLTSPEPDREECSDKFYWRKVARMALVISLLGNVLRRELSASLSRFGHLASVASVMFVYALGLLAAFHYLARLARRMPQRRLAKHAIAVGWSLAALTVLKCLSTAVFNLYFASGVSGRAAGSPEGALEICLMVSFWVTGIAGGAIKLWALILCTLYARCFWRLARVSVGTIGESSAGDTGVGS